MSDFHFFASSVADWVTTTEERDLREVMYLMDKFGYDYNLFYVPVRFDQNYEIKMYQPQVEGSIWLGHYKVERKDK